LPPLGLLTALSKGKLEAGMADVLKLTDKLEADLPHMLAEHAKAENKPESTLCGKTDSACANRRRGALSDGIVDWSISQGCSPWPKGQCRLTV
jgi:hypothetical protein